jgi:hypothetical protein
MTLECASHRTAQNRGCHYDRHVHGLELSAGVLTASAPAATRDSGIRQKVRRAHSAADERRLTVSVTQAPEQNRPAGTIGGRFHPGGPAVRVSTSAARGGRV